MKSPVQNPKNEIRMTTRCDGATARREEFRNPNDELRGAHAPRVWRNAPPRSAIRTASFPRRIRDLFVRPDFSARARKYAPVGGCAPRPDSGFRLGHSFGFRISAFVFAVLLSTILHHLSTPAAHAQYSIDWHTIDGGGGTSTGGPMIGVNYSVSGTIGQADAGGPMTGGNRKPKNGGAK